MGINTYAQNVVSFYRNSTTVTTRSAQTPNADWNGGMNRGGSNSNGVGINTGNYDPKLSDWTLNNQAGAARNPQNSMHIGGSGLTTGNTTVTAINAVLVNGTDLNDTFSFVTAAQATAPGSGLSTGGTGPINRTGETVPLGARCWGTNTV